MVFYHSQGSSLARVKGNLDLFQSFNIHGPAANVLILNASTAESARRSPFVLLLYQNHIEIHTQIKYLLFDSLNGLSCRSRLYLLLRFLPQRKNMEVVQDFEKK